MQHSTAPDFKLAELRKATFHPKNDFSLDKRQNVYRKQVLKICVISFQTKFKKGGNNYKA